jgi:hypothetical protein
MAERPISMSHPSIAFEEMEVYFEDGFRPVPRFRKDGTVHVDLVNFTGTIILAMKVC